MHPYFEGAVYMLNKYGKSYPLWVFNSVPVSTI